MGLCFGTLTKQPITVAGGSDVHQGRNHQYRSNPAPSSEVRLFCFLADCFPVCLVRHELIV
jgi:hypothetical protein